MIGKLLLLTALSTPAFAQGSYILDGCDEDACLELGKGNISELLFGQNIRTTKKADKKNSPLFLETISKTTGLAMDAVSTIVNGMRETALGAGFHNFRSELTGPSGTVSFEMDLKSGNWNVFVSGSVGSTSSKNIK